MRCPGPTTLFRPIRFALLPLLLAGCSYDPPVKADRSSEKYRADLARCDAEGAREASKVTGATPWTFIKSPFTYPPLKHAHMRECLTRRGYVIEE